MVRLRSIAKTIFLTLVVVMAVSFLNNASAQDGKALFSANCASCHAINKRLTGPALMGVEERWPDKKELFAFIRNPSLVIKRNAYAKKLKDVYGTLMTAFPDLTDEAIAAILDYIRREGKAKPITIE